MIGEKTSGAGAMTQDVGVRFPTKQVFGLRVHGVNEAQFQELVWRCASNGQGFAATYATAHSLTMSRGDAVFRDTVNAFDVCYPDGRGVGLVTVLLGQGLMPKTTANRFFLPLCRRAAEAGLGIALIGGRPGIAEKVAEVIRALNPSARVSTCDGFCSTQRMTALNGFDANIVFLAMGQPKQEYVAVELRAKLPRAVVICVGGLFDVVAGVLPTCPEWVRSVGMEWGFRLVTRPRQVWRRYLVGLPVVAAMVVAKRITPRVFANRR